MLSNSHASSFKTLFNKGAKTDDALFASTDLAFVLVNTVFIVAVFSRAVIVPLAS